MQSPRMEFGFGGMSFSALRVAAKDIFKNGFSYSTLPLILDFPSPVIGDNLNPCWSGYQKACTARQVVTTLRSVWLLGSPPHVNGIEFKSPKPEVGIRLMMPVLTHHLGVTSQDWICQFLWYCVSHCGTLVRDFLAELMESSCGLTVYRRPVVIDSSTHLYLPLCSWLLIVAYW